MPQANANDLHWYTVSTLITSDCSNHKTVTLNGQQKSANDESNLPVIKC